MPGAGAPIIRFGTSQLGAAAAADVATDGASGAALTVVFATGEYNHDELGIALAARGITRVVGVTSGRVIGPAGVQAQGVTGFHLPASRFAVADTLIENAAELSLPEAHDRIRRLWADLEQHSDPGLEHRFAMLFVDGEARCEERLTAMLGMGLNGVPLVGGSAGDLYFNPLGHGPAGAPLLYRSRGTRSSAILCLVASKSPIVAYCHNHYVTGGRRAVITRAEPQQRVVHEIDGRPALGVYASLCGFRTPPRSGEGFASRPMMVKIGGQHYPRGVQRIRAGGALEFACAMERGLVVTIAKPGDMVARLKDLFDSMRARIGMPELVIGLDCAARATYMEQEGLTRRVETLLSAHAVTGFATLGEQYNAIHANNSLTCLGIAAPS